jgi:hypothetical protein
MNDFSEYFEHSLTEMQSDLLSALSEFVKDESSKVFVLNGFAGTGKTWIVAGFMRWLIDEEIDYVMLASTGRAAKVLSDKCGADATTVHKHIYTFDDLDDDLAKLSELQQNYAVDDKGQLKLLFSLKPFDNETTTVYIIDESSMISDSPDTQLSYAKFGNGRLLQDIFSFDKKGKFVFVGDHCQLPPINEAVSPALSPDYIVENFSYAVREFTLSEIFRQKAGNSIVDASFGLRELWRKNPPGKWARFPLAGFTDILLHRSKDELIELYAEKLKSEGYDNTILICQTNRHCTEMNSLIRGILGRSSVYPEVGDLVLVTQNNYLTGLVNGDLIEILKIGTKEFRAGLTFVPVIVKELVSGSEHSVLLVEEVLLMQGTNLNMKQHKDLYIEFYKRMSHLGISQKDKRFRDQMFVDPYLNSLRAVYGYAVTCHKSQGGEWNEVYLLLDNKIQGLPRPGIYQWMYTAVTRARETLHIVDDWFIQ